MSGMATNISLDSISHADTLNFPLVKKSDRRGHVFSNCFKFVWEIVAKICRSTWNLLKKILPCFFNKLGETKDAQTLNNSNLKGESPGRLNRNLFRKLSIENRHRYPIRAFSTHSGSSNLESITRTTDKNAQDFLSVGDGCPPTPRLTPMGRIDRTDSSDQLERVDRLRIPIEAESEAKMRGQQESFREVASTSTFSETGHSENMSPPGDKSSQNMLAPNKVQGSEAGSPPTFSTLGVSHSNISTMSTNSGVFVLMANESDQLSNPLAVEST